MAGRNTLSDGFNKLFKSGDEVQPFLLLDDDFNCTKSLCPEIMEKGENLMAISEDNITGKTRAVKIYRSQEEYVAELFRVGSDPSGYLCRVAASGDIFDIAQKAGVFNTAANTFLQMDSHISELWMEAAKSDNQVFNDLLYQLSVSNKKQVELFMLYDSRLSDEALDILKLCSILCGRCVSYLGEMRAVKFRCITDKERLNIRCGRRQSTVALMNLIQNSMLYSDGRCPPELVLSTDEDGRFAVITVTNIIRSSLLQTADSEIFRAGTGIRYVRRFAELTGGSFSIRRVNNTCVAELMLPVPQRIPAHVRMQQLDSAEYVTAVPDFVQLMLYETAKKLTLMDT